VSDEVESLSRSASDSSVNHHKNGSLVTSLTSQGSTLAPPGLTSLAKTGLTTSQISIPEPQAGLSYVLFVAIWGIYICLTT